MNIRVYRSSTAVSARDEMSMFGTDSALVSMPAASPVRGKDAMNHFRLAGEAQLPLSDDPEPSHSFETVALPHMPSVRAFALSLAGDFSSAEDLVQDTFLRALKAFDRFTPGTDCRSWLFRICKNRFYDHCRRRLRRPLHEDIDLAQPISHDRSWELQKEQERLENGDQPRLDLVGDAVRNAIRNLPGKFREPLLMCDLDGLGYQEIAQNLSVPLGTIRSRISRARGRLRDELKDYARESGFPVDALPAA